MAQILMREILTKINKIKTHSSVSAAKKTKKRRAAHKCVIYRYRKVAKFSLLYLQNY